MKWLVFILLPLFLASSVLLLALLGPWIGDVRRAKSPAPALSPRWQEAKDQRGLLDDPLYLDNQRFLAETDKELSQ